jgi:hypothetical protein
MPRDAAILRPRINLDISPSSWICAWALDFSAEEPAGLKKRIEEFRSEFPEKPKLYFLANLIVTKSAGS